MSVKSVESGERGVGMACHQVVQRRHSTPLGEVHHIMHTRHGPGSCLDHMSNTSTEQQSTPPNPNPPTPLLTMEPAEP